MVPGASEHRKTLKNLQIFPWEGLGASGKKSEKFIRKRRSERLFRRIFSNFSMLAHVLSHAGGLEALILIHLVTRRAYFLCSIE